MRTAALVLALGLVVACGVKGRPLPPELVRPTPPTQLVAKSTPEGVRLSWRRPTSYTGGKAMRDLGGFTIDRATGAEGDEFAQVGTVELTDQTRFQQQKSVEWTDTTPVVGETYRYRVIAYTLDGYRSAPAGPLAVAYSGKPEPEVRLPAGKKPKPPSPPAPPAP